MFGKFGSLLSFSSHFIGRNGATRKRRQAESWEVSTSTEPLEIRAVPAITQGTDINITQVTGDQADAQIAINPANPNQIVVVGSTSSGSGGNELGFYISNDGGASWNQKPLGFGQDFVNSPSASRENGSVAFDGYGNIHVTYVVGGSTVVYAFSGDGGDSFVTQNFLDFSFHPRPRVAVGPSSTSSSIDDQVWLTFEQDTPLFFTYSFQAVTSPVLGPNLPPTLNVASNLFGDTLQQWYAYPAISPAGGIAIVRQLSNSSSGASSLITTQDIDGTKNGVVLDLATQFAASSNSGYLESYTATATSFNEFGASAQIAYDRSNGPHRGRLYLVYTDETPDESNDSNVLLRFSDNNGLSWSSARRVNDDLGFNSQFLPSLSVDPVTGLVVIGWYDARRDVAGQGIDTNNRSNDEVEYYIAASNNGGVSFMGANTRVSDGASRDARSLSFSGFGNNTGVVAYDGDAYVSWADNSNSTGDNPNPYILDPTVSSSFDLYFDKVSIDPNLPPNVTAIPDIAILEDTNTGPLQFTISDTRTAASSLVVTAKSSNPSVIPDSGLILGGTAGNRSITVIPTADRSGTATITISVFDGRFTTESTFVVDVLPTPDPFPSFPEDPSTTWPVIDNQTSTPITDDAIPTLSTITVAGLDNNLVDANVFINISHTRNSDLTVVLISPQGTRVTLTSGNGGDNDDVFAGTEFDDQAISTPVTDYTFTDGVAGPYLVPEGALAQLVLENPNGDWTLEVTDNVTGETGTLNSWGLELTTTASALKLQPFITASNSQLVNIPDAMDVNSETVNGEITSKINFNGLDFYTWDVNLHVNISHAHSGDLDIYLISPSGVEVLISSGNGGANASVFQFPTTFDDQANPPTPVTDATFTDGSPVGVVIPEAALAGFVGENPNGDWTLRIVDHTPTNVGALIDWSLDITTVFINDAPTIGSINNPDAIPEDVDLNQDHVTDLQTVYFNSVTAGGNEVQPLRVTAVSSNPALIPNPTVNYTNGDNTGSITYTPQPNQFGIAIITVTVEDGGYDGLLSTPDDNAKTEKRFTVVVNAVNDPPTIDQVPAPTPILEDAGAQQLQLTGVSAGGGETQQLLITAKSSLPEVMLDPVVEYTPGASTAILHYQSNPDFYGLVTITVTVTDAGIDNDLSETADNSTKTISFVVEIQPVNDLPTLDPILNPQPINEDSPPQQFGLSGISAGGRERQELRVTAVSSNTDVVPEVAVLYSSADEVGTLSFRPTANAFGSTVITVTVEDGGLDGLLSTPGDNATFERSFTVQVNEVNDSPVFNNPGSVISLNEDPGQQTVQLTGISSGPFENQPLAFQAVTSSNPGLISNPTITYTNPNTTGTLRFNVTPNSSGGSLLTITLMDGGLDNNLSTLNDNGYFQRQITVTVASVNDAPTIDNIASPAPFDEDSDSKTIALTGITAGGGETQPLKIVATSDSPSIIPDPVISYTSGNSTGSLQYSPQPNQYGTVVITVVVTDGGPDNDLSTTVDNLSTTKFFTVTINPINDAPFFDEIADPDPISEDGGAQSIDIFGVTAGENEVQQLQFTATSSNPSILPDPTIGYFQGSSSANLNYQPAPGASGTVVVTITVTDPGLDGDFLTLNDNLSYSQDIQIVINPSNDTPTINAITNPNAILEDALTQLVNLSGLSSGDLGQVFKVTATSGNTTLIPNGNITVNHTGSNPTGSVSYRPAADQFGTAVITVTVTDGGFDNNLATTEDNLTNFATFLVTVTAVNDVPTLNSLGASYDLSEGASQQVINLTGISAGGGENQPVRITVVSDDTSLIPTPTVTYNDPSSVGTLTFTPLANKSGATTLHIRVEDGGLDGNLATTNDNAFIIRDLPVNVTAVNDPPTIANVVSPLVIPEDFGPTTIGLSGISAGPGEIQSLQITAVSNNHALIPDPVVIYVDGQPTASLTFTPVANQSGTATITITLEDAGGAITTQELVVTVTAVNDAPTINSLGGPVTIDEDAVEQTVNLTGISAGPGESGQVFNVEVSSNRPDIIPNPTLVYTPGSSTGLFRYRPLADQNGQVILSVRITDGGADNNLATTADNLTTTVNLTVNVTSLPETPTLTIDQGSLYVTGGRPTAVAPSATLTDLDSPNYKNGVVNFQIIAGAQSSDQFQLQAFGSGSSKIHATKSGQLKQGKNVIGTITGGGSTLSITFTADVDANTVEKIIRNVRFRGSKSQTGLRTVQVSVTDNTALVSAPKTRTVVLN